MNTNRIVEDAHAPEAASSGVQQRDAGNELNVFTSPLQAQRFEKPTTLHCNCIGARLVEHIARGTAWHVAISR